MPLSRTAYVNLLRSQTGYHEGRDKNGNWNNIQRFSPETLGLEWSQGQAWCSTFTSWGADELGGRDVIPITASCAAGVDWWQDRDRWTDYPVLGGLFYMGSRGQDHVGVVYAYDADSIYTVEGNTNTTGAYQGDGVYQRVRPRRGPSSPYGYGVPAFTEGTISADPKLGGTPSASVAAPTPPQVSVSLAHLVAAARRDPGLRQGGTTYPAEVNVVEVALAREGLLQDAYAHDGSFGSLTVAAYAGWQRRQGYSGSDADGIPGKTSLTALGKAHAFTVID
ncbi:hypothetical protein [Streptomyces sp. NPDC056387]|uniref:hypothetical protein n=1 Tax=Streptomyces sp. NPDC056387 TaxID=3345803 RepID=UPI0035E1C328